MDTNTLALLMAKIQAAKTTPVVKAKGEFAPVAWKRLNEVLEYNLVVGKDGKYTGNVSLKASQGFTLRGGFSSISASPEALIHLILSAAQLETILKKAIEIKGTAPIAE